MPSRARARRGRRCREARPYAQAFSDALAASITLERGNLDLAVSLYAEAARGFEALEMGLHAAAMRCRQGEVVLGEEGRALLDCMTQPYPVAT